MMLLKSIFQGFILHYISPAASIHFSDWGGGGGVAKVRKMQKKIGAAKMKIVYVLWYFYVRFNGL